MVLCTVRNVNKSNIAVNAAINIIDSNPHAASELIRQGNQVRSTKLSVNL